jgi:transcription antitermination factor NusG
MVLNPKLKERRYIRRRAQSVISPLFPCYLFVRFDPGRDFRLIRYTRGVRSVVGTENAPSAVSEDIIVSIQERMKGGAVSVEPERFCSGEEVLIKAGPFEGLRAVFEREMKGPERVIVLLRALNARAVIDQAALERCTPWPAAKRVRPPLLSLEPLRRPFT